MARIREPGGHTKTSAAPVTSMARRRAQERGAEQADSLNESSTGRLLAISDLHVHYSQNREFLSKLTSCDGDWLIVAGDVGESFEDVAWALGTLAKKFSHVIWTPGNHELWTTIRDPIQLRGNYRYQRLISLCRNIGVCTPEDPYPIWNGPGGPVMVAPIFVLYDYTFRQGVGDSAAEALTRAYHAGVVCTDEFLLHSDPYPSRQAWCMARLLYTERRLTACTLPTVLVNHFPLIQKNTAALRYPEFAQWCGTVRTADWHVRYNATAVVYGHLHMPRTTFHDGVRFEEVSVGYPSEWIKWGGPTRPRQVLPVLGRDD